MSKSHPNPKSRIILTDTAQDIKSKIRVAVTDSINEVTYDPITRPGVSNLIDIIFHLDPAGTSSVEELAADLQGLPLKALKEKATDVIDEHLSPIRERYSAIVSDQSRLDEVAEIGAQRANETAKATMTLVRDAIGL